MLLKPIYHKVGPLSFAQYIDFFMIMMYMFYPLTLTPLAVPKELDLYIPAAQEELYNWVNGPNRQYEAGFRIVQSGEWGDYDAFYLMEGDSVPVVSLFYSKSCSSLCLIEEYVLIF